MFKMSKKVGIIGGMGPEATVDLMTKIIRATPAQTDQEHIRTIVDNNPQIPSRVDAILGDGASPGPVMADMAKNLEKSGADFLAIPCNTAHYYLPDVKEAVKIPVIDMIEETVKVLKADNIEKVALLATKATLATKLYEKKLTEEGINLILPAPDFQEKVVETIAAVKAGDFAQSQKYTGEIIQHCVELGAQAVILGCTELPIAYKNRENFNIVFYDPTDILAKAIVRDALS
jgi:aspartate racemase